MSIYCFGHISTGKLYRIKGSYPEANGYGEILSVEENYSGEALSTSLVLNRLGVDVTLNGNWISDSNAGKRTLDFIKKNGINAPEVHIQKGYEGATEIVISDESSRTVFGKYVDLLFTTQQWDNPETSEVLKAKVVTCDPGFINVALQISLTCVENNIPFVGIDSSFDSWYSLRSSVLIISEDFLKREYPHQDYATLFDNYLKSTTGLVIFTFGANPIWYGRTERNEYAVFPVTPKDTAGAGDSFRAGIMYGLLQYMSDIELVQFASAVSASVIQTSPGVINFLGLNAVQDVLKTKK